MKHEIFWLNRCNTDINELSMWLWRKAQEGDLKALKIKKNTFVLKYYLNKAKRKVENQYIETFGIDKGFKKYLDLICKIQLLKNKIAISGDKSDQIFVDMLEVELGELTENKNLNDNFDETTVLIEKFMQFKIDLKKTNVFEYYNYLNSLKKSLKNGK